MKSCKSVLISQCHGHGASSARCWPSVINLRGASTVSELMLDSDQEREPGVYGSYIAGKKTFGFLGNTLISVPSVFTSYTAAGHVLLIKH